MNSYKVKGIILAVIISLASIMMPFTVYADTIDNHIIGRNISYEFIQGDQYNGYAVNQSVFHVEIVLDGDYIGFMQPNFTLQYYNYFYGSNPPVWNTMQIQFTNRVFVNGNTVNFDIPVKWNSTYIGQSQLGTDPYFYDSYTITSSNVTAYGEIESLNQIIDILNENQDIISDIYSELQNIVSNTSLANQYLDTISNIKKWDFPFESFSIIVQAFRNELELSDLIDTYYTYPIFSVHPNEIMLDYSLNNVTPKYVIFAYTPNYDIWDTNRLNVAINNSNSNVNFEYIDSYPIDRINNINRKLIKAKLSCTGTQSGTLKFNYNGNYIPIYYGSIDNKNVSTDFALMYGLSNDLLDNIQIIANGTTQSNSAASYLESEASEYSEIADDVIGVEEGLTSNFETEVNKIDLNTGLNVFGGNFMTSATWVRTQFDRLTENTPYGSLVVYGLTLGFALLMLGKVFL